jgi:hypothetical protein
MTLSAILDRVDDWINPIVVKELRQAVKSRMVVGILMLFLGLQLFLLGSFLLLGDMGDEININWNLGNRVFCWQQGILLVTLMLMVPAYAAARLGAERSDHNVDLLFISTLKSRSIISGKLFAALVLAVLIYSTCAPFMTFTYLLRGIDIPTILTVLGIDLLFMLVSTMFALFLAAIPGQRAIKFFLAFLGFILLALLCWGMVRLTIGLIEEGTAVFEGLFDFWMVLAVTVAGILGIVGMLFVYSVALISPATSNRILPMRLYLFALWLIMGGGLFAVSYSYRSGPTFVPIVFWVLVGAILVCIQFCISICERERWGPRMLRSIPRRAWARPLAFLFWTGSAGGITLTTLLGLGTLLGAWRWSEEYNTGTRDWEGMIQFIDMMAIICLYTYCYGMSAVLIRTHVLAGQLKTSLTWLIAMLLVGLGSSIPSVIAWIFFQDQVRHSEGGNGWWMLPNPFIAAYEFFPSGRYGAGYDNEFKTICHWFLGTWAVLATVLALPWYIAQVRRFHPPRKREPEFVPLMLVETPASVAAG